MRVKWALFPWMVTYSEPNQHPLIHIPVHKKKMPPHCLAMWEGGFALALISGSPAGSRFFIFYIFIIDALQRNRQYNSMQFGFRLPRRLYTKQKHKTQKKKNSDYSHLEELKIEVYSKPDGKHDRVNYSRYEYY